MIVLSKTSKQYIESLVDKGLFCEELDCSGQTLSNIVNENTAASNNFIERFLKITGMKFESAFEFKPDKKS